ncbi:S-layer protein [Candidatus Woesearchaeota archaeon]|nr:S-layer protein [Candidatus Woesearchaeota archaeon]
MKVKRAIKKIIALGTGATMLGATILGAMAADLSSYPAPFVDNGKTNTNIVVGKDAMVVDVVGAINIGASLQYAMKKKADVSSAGGAATVEGDAYRLDKSSNFIELEEAINTIGITKIGSDELQALAGGTFKNKEGSYSYNEYLKVPNNASVYYTVDPDAEGDMEDVPGYYLLFEQASTASTADSGEAYIYTVEFPTAAEESLTDQDTDLDGWHNKKITMLGNEYEIVDSTLATNDLTIEMLGGAASDTLDVGETKTYTVAGKDYEITVLAVCESCGAGGNAATKLKVNGQVTDSLEAGDTESLDDGTEIGIKDVFPTGQTMPDIVEFYVGASKVILQDDDITDNNFYAGYTVGTDSINDVYVRIKGTHTTNVDAKIQSIDVGWWPNEDKYVGVGGKLSETEDEDGQVFLGGFDVTLAGVSESITDELTFKNKGDDEYQLTFPNSDGNEVKVPAFYASGATTVANGDGSDDLFYVESAASTTFPIGDEDKFFLSDAASKTTTLMQFKSISTNDNELTFRNLATGDDVTVTYSGSPATATLTVGAKSYTVYVDATNKLLAVDLNGDGDVASDEVALYTKAGLTIGLDAAALVLTTEDLDATSAAETLYINISASGSELDISGIYDSAFASIMATVGDSDDSAGVSLYGMTFDQSGDTSGPDTLAFTYPEDQTQMVVYMTAGATTTQSGEEAGATYTLSQMPVTVPKLDTEYTLWEENAIIVGGPCVNTAAMEVMGNPENCAEGFEEGKAKIKMYESGGKTALLVAGYSGTDTRRAARVLAQYMTYSSKLTGTEVEVSGTTLSDISVSKVE